MSLLITPEVDVQMFLCKRYEKKQFLTVTGVKLKNFKSVFVSTESRTAGEERTSYFHFHCISTAFIKSVTKASGQEKLSGLTLCGHDQSCWSSLQWKHESCSPSTSSCWLASMGSTGSDLIQGKQTDQLIQTWNQQNLISNVCIFLKSTTH